MKRLIGLAVLLCIASFAYVPAAKASTVALTWTLSTADTTTACAATGANCSQTVYRATGPCSSTSVFVSIATPAVSATSFTDTTPIYGQSCYAVSFTINGVTSVIFATGQTDFATVSLPPPPPSGLATVATP
jgi:hypothetical protein